MKATAPAGLPQVEDDPAALRTILFGGLNDLYGRAEYLRPAWLRQHGLAGPNLYILGWYAPLLEQGYSLPFQVILDLGLMVLEGLHYRERLARKPDQPFSRFLGEVRRWPLFRALLADLEHDASQRRRKDSPSPRGLQAQAAGMADFGLRFQAARIFLEHCLAPLDTLHTPDRLLDPRAVRALAWDDLTWQRLADRLERGENVLAEPEQLQYQQLAAASQAFHKKLADLLPAAALRLTPVEGCLVRAANLGFLDRPALDLALLDAYHQKYYQPGLEPTIRSLELLKRSAYVSIQTPSLQAEGGYQGISRQGKWSSLMRGQFALLHKTPELFLNNLYNHNALYYQRVSQRSRPVSLLTAVFIDSRPPMHFPVHGGRSRYAFGREMAAYLLEDQTQYLLGLGLRVDQYLAAFPWSESYFHGFFRPAEFMRPIKPGGPPDPLLTNIPGIFPDYFRLVSSVTPLPGPIPPAPLADAAGDFLRQMNTESARRAALGEASLYYDCLNIVILTDQEPQQQEAAAVTNQVAGLARRSAVHWFQLARQQALWFLQAERAGPFAPVAGESFAQFGLPNPNPDTPAVRTQFLTLAAQQALNAAS
jgi:hypothetical protein